MGEGSSTGGFIPEDVVTSISDAVTQAKEDIVGVITGNFNTILYIVGAMVGLSLLFWVGRVVRRAMSNR